MEGRHNEVKRRFRLLIAVAGLLLTCFGFILYAFHAPNTFEGDARDVTVSRGQTFAAVTDTLLTRGILRSRFLFTLVARIAGTDVRLQVGRYRFQSGLSNAEILRALVEGKNTVTLSVTLPEGLLARQQARILARTLGIDSARYMRLVTDRAFIESLQVSARSLEGYLFPETYSFAWQPDERQIVRAQVEEFRKLYTDDLEGRARSLGWTTGQVLTFASIVQGEAAVREEMPRIAGVYHNRLRKGMLLQADPTIQYFIDRGPRRVLYSDLRMDHPYNTYRKKGLPPGPVNNPGRDAILAALYPEHHTYLFFVANGNGGHWFTSTYPEHMRYVRKFRKDRQLRQTQGGGTAEKKKGPSLH
jgi:UPF0755 protein